VLLVVISVVRNSGGKSKAFMMISISEAKKVKRHALWCLARISRHFAHCCNPKNR